jgi:hypothetical protein
MTLIKARRSWSSKLAGNSRSRDATRMACMPK